jgi:hypothetical protein
MPVACAATWVNLGKAFYAVVFGVLGMDVASGRHSASGGHDSWKAVIAMSP